MLVTDHVSLYIQNNCAGFHDSYTVFCWMSMQNARVKTFVVFFCYERVATNIHPRLAHDCWSERADLCGFAAADNRDSAAHRLTDGALAASTG